MGWVGAGMENMMVCMRYKVWRVGRMSGYAGALPDYEVMTRGHTAIQVRSSGYGQAGIGRTSWKGLSTGCHKKAPVCCPCSRLAALHGAPRTLMALSMESSC